MTVGRENTGVEYGKTTYIELCDEDGRKVRVTISGHWQGLIDKMAAHTVDEPSMWLSDVEYDPNEPCSQFFPPSTDRCMVCRFSRWDHK